MKVTNRKLFVGVLWLALIGLVLPVSLLAVNPVTEASIFTYVFANTCDPDFAVTVTRNGFQPQTITTTVLTDTVVGGTFVNDAGQPVTVTFPEGMFGYTTTVLDEGEVSTVCEPNPQGGENVITGTINGGDFTMTVNVITEAISHAVGGEILSNPFMSMLPGISLVFLMVVVLYAGRKIKKVPGI